MTGHETKPVPVHVMTTSQLLSSATVQTRVEAAWPGFCTELYVNVNYYNCTGLGKNIGFSVLKTLGCHPNLHLNSYKQFQWRKRSSA